MKTITNEAYCADCTRIGTPIIMDNIVVCYFCGSSYLFDPNFRMGELKTFLPIYKESETFQASKYCPHLTERRKNNRQWPIIRERRGSILFPWSL